MTRLPSNPPGRRTVPKDPEVLAELGLDAERMSAVRALFRHQIRDEVLHPGAALAVYAKGHLVLDEQAGLADTQQARLVRDHTLFPILSCSKVLTTLAVLQQLQQGRLSLDAPVADYWPEFAQHDKQTISVRHVLSHRAGMPLEPRGTRWQEWLDPEVMACRMEAVRPATPPGREGAYHPMAFGWILGELVFRVCGRRLGEQIQKELTTPLGLHDMWLGLPHAQLERTARLHAMPDAGLEGARVVRSFNQPQILQACIPGGGGVTTARDLARLMSLLGGLRRLAEGEPVTNRAQVEEAARVLDPALVLEATVAEGPAHPDAVLGIRVQRGLGFFLGGAMGAADPKGQRSTARTFGHAGVTGSVCWADSEHEVAVAFTPNGVRWGGEMFRRTRDLSDAVRDAVRVRGRSSM